MTTRPPQPPIDPHQDMANAMRTGAEAFVAHWKNMGGEELDYSPPTVLRLDELVLAFRNRGASGPQVEQLLRYMGIYLGEVLARESGGAWVDASVIDPGVYGSVAVAAIRLSNGTLIDPLDRPKHLLEHGDGHELAGWFAQMMLHARR